MVNKRKTPFGQTLRDRRDAFRRWQYSMMAAGAVALTTMTPTLCAPTMASIFKNLTEIIFEIAFYVGAVILIIGIFNFILANKDENADGQSRAIKFCVVGIALIALKTLVNPILNSLTY